MFITNLPLCGDGDERFDFPKEVTDTCHLGSIAYSYLAGLLYNLDPSHLSTALSSVPLPSI